MAVPVPAVCDTCGTIWPTDVSLAQGTSGIGFFGNKASPCPNCGGVGSIPDGIYEFIGETLNIVSSWSPERIQRFTAALELARGAPDARAATEAVIAQHEDLLDLAKRLLVPRDAGQFWAFVAALLALLALLQASQTDKNIT